MAVQPYTIVEDKRHGTYCVMVKWVLGNGDTGQPFDGIEFPDKTVHMYGTFGAAVVLQGSNEVASPTNWIGLSDPQGTAISMSALAIEAVLENPYWVRPSAGAVTSVTVLLSCAQSRR